MPDIQYLDHQVRCYEFFTCSSSKCPGYHSDATCWHLLGTLCTRDDAHLPEHRGSLNSVQCPHSNPSQLPARTYDDKMSSCTCCDYFAHVIATYDEPIVLPNTGAGALSWIIKKRSERESTMLMAMRDGQQLLQGRRRPPRPKAKPRTDTLVFPLRMQDRLSGLMMITSESELVCTDDTLEFIRLVSEVTSAGRFGTSLFEYLETSYHQIVMALANAVAAKDPYTRRHSERVAFYSIQIAMALNLTKQEKEHLSFAAMLHDIGKIGTNTDILQKKDKLAAQEQDDIKAHPVIGARILEPVHFLKPIIAAIRHHHENYDGSGYPSGLKGADIPLKARIVKIADAWDAMTSDRAYRKALCRSRALEQLARYSGTQFDPELVEVFIQTPAIQDGLSSLSGL